MLRRTTLQEPFRRVNVWPHLGYDAHTESAAGFGWFINALKYMHYI
jgi:hypothetical protein